MTAAPSAVVVGGGSGIGAAVATRLCAQGRRVLIADHRVPDEVPEGARTAEVDVTSTASVDALFAVAAESGPVGTVVVTAGIPAPALAHEVSDERWQRMVDVHLTGALRCARAAHPHLRRQPSSALVLLSSPAARFGGPGRSSYAAAKAGVEGLTRVLAVEWAPEGIRVNAVSPGFTTSPMLTRLIEDGQADAERMRARVPLGRLAEPDDIAGAICFLTSPDAGYVTGQVLVVDGGLLVDGRG